MSVHEAGEWNAVAQRPHATLRIASVLTIAGLLTLAWLLLDVVLLFFAGILLAVFLHALGTLVERHSPLSRPWALTTAIVLLVAVLAAAATLSSQRVAQQTMRLGEEMPHAMKQARGALEQQPWGRWLLAHAPSADTLMASRQPIMSATTSVLSGTLGAVTTLTVVLFLGLYLAIQPRLYRDGMVRLVPIRRRARVVAVLDEVGGTLRWWLAGKLFAMALIGTATALGLIVLGIQAPIALGLLAALLTFVPNFGPVIAAVPALLLAMLSGPATALWVAALYVSIQMVESYVVTPLVQERTVSLPPALTIAAQVVLGVTAGLLGLALATPLVAASLVLVRRLYVEDVLGDRLSGDRDRDRNGDRAAPDRASRMVYPPLDTVKPIADDVWIVDGPAIEFGVAGARLPFPTRMTIMRLAEGLLVHSPTELTDTLRTEVAGLGTPRWIVGPNRLHGTWIAQWHDAFPEAALLIAPGLRRKLPSRVAALARPLGSDDEDVFGREVDVLPVVGDCWTEIVLFHRASRTLVLADLIENFEPSKLPGKWMSWLTRLGAVQDPDGAMPRDMRLTFVRRRAELRRAVRTMVDWNPERIVLAHGRWYPRDGAAELRRAFRWLLEPSSA